MPETHPDRVRRWEGQRDRRPPYRLHGHPQRRPAPRRFVHRELTARPRGAIERTRHRKAAPLQHQIGHVTGIGGGRRGPG